MRFALVPFVLLLVHPLHTTHTDLTESDGRVMVQVRAFTDDLHSAVTKREGGSGDSALAHYLRGTITLADSAGRPVPLAYTGKEIQGDITILRLRTISATHLASIQVRQLMQMELFSDQVNVVQAAYGGRRVSLLFVSGDGPKRLP